MTSIQLERKLRQTLNDTMKMQGKTFFMEALVSSREDRKVILGDIPVSFDLAGFMIDAKEMATAALPADGKNMTKKQIDFAMVYGHEASYQENRVFEDSMFWLNGWSAVKGLQMLKAMDVSISELTPPFTYINPNLPDVVVTDINNALNMGWRVVVPEDTGGLPVVPYIKYDPQTGSAGFMIAAMAGGSAGYMEANVQLLDLISYSLTWPTLWRTPIGMDFEAVTPEDGITVAQGDIFNIFLKMTVKWKNLPSGEEWTELVSGPDSFITIRTGPWIFIESGPLPWWLPGHYNILYNGLRIFNFNIWGPKIDSTASGKYIGVNSNNGVDSTSNSVLIKYSVKEYNGVSYSSASMKVKKGDTVIRTINNLPVGENKLAGWDGRDDSGSIVAPDDYTAVIEAVGNGKTETSNKHKVTVFKVEITTPTTTPMDITAEPAMPTVTFNARILPSSVRLSDATFKWYLDMSFRRDGQSSDDRHRVPTTGMTETVGNSNWKPTWGTLIAGGNIHVYVAAVLAGVEIRSDQDGYEIKGINPDIATVALRLGSDPLRAICCHESDFEQFDAPPNGGIGWPLPNRGHDSGYGLMMHTPANESETWIWTASVDDGISLYNTNIEQSRNHLNNWNGTTPYPALSPKPNPPITMTEEQHMMNAFSLYRRNKYYYGARRIGDTTAYELYRLPSAGSDYADSVRSEMKTNTRCRY